MRHRLTDPWQSRIVCSHMIEIQVHWRIIGICFELRYDRSSTTYVAIQLGKKTVSEILSTCVRIWDTVRWFVTFPQLALAYDESSGAPMSPGHISLWPSLHSCQSHSAICKGHGWLSSCVRIWDSGSHIDCKATACAGISLWFRHTARSYLSDYATETRRRYSWLSCRFQCWRCPWPVIEDQAHLRSAIQSRMIFLVSPEANFDKLWPIMDESIQPRHASTATISLRSIYTPAHSAIIIWVCFILIMCSLALNQWMLCTEIVISQDTWHLSASGSSRSASAIISIYAWLVCKGSRENNLNCQLHVTCPLQEGSHA